MLPNMDYSLIQRTPDGTGKILVTTPGSPDKGSFVLEADMKIYTNQGMVAIADIVDDLVTADAAKPLSANQGVVLKQLIDAFSGGIVPKGDILSSNLPPADASNKGWQYYCTDINQWATSDGTQWIMTSNNVITQTPDATDTGHALSNAVVTQCCNEVKGKLNQHESRLENLEQKAGDYTTVQYRGTNAVPTGKAKNGLVEKIVGKSRAWNQLVSPSLNYASEVYGITREDAGTGKLRYYGTCSNTTNFTGFSIYSYTSGHKYLILLNCELPSGARIDIGNTDKQNYYIGELSSISFGVYINSGTVVDFTITPVIRDLTLIFGSGNEPSTVADALAQLPVLGQYNAYDAGSLVDTEVSGVESVGVNVWNEEWGNYQWNETTGARQTDSTRIGCADLIPITPNTSYYLIASVVKAFFIRFYNHERNYIGAGPTSDPNEVFTSPINAYYMTFHLQQSYGTTYNHDIQICDNALPNAIKTTYHPYMTDTLSLSETVTLRSVGSVSDELDVESGVIMRKVGTYTFDGTESWTQSSDASYCSIDAIKNYVKVPSSNTVAGVANCAILSNKAWHSINYDGEVGIAITYVGNFGVTTSYIPSLTGQTITFELATPTTEAIDPIIDNFIEVEGGGTVEIIQEQTPVIDNCLDVGYLTV